MPIDLSAYTKPIKDAIRRGGLACVYVAASDEVCRIGYSEEMTATAGRMQRSSPVSLTIENLLWVPDRGMATTIAKATQCELADQKRPNNWFAISAVAACHAVDMVAFRLYPGATMINHDQLIGHWVKRKVA